MHIINIIARTSAFYLSL